MVVPKLVRLVFEPACTCRSPEQSAQSGVSIFGIVRNYNNRYVVKGNSHIVFRFRVLVGASFNPQAMRNV